MKVSFIIPAYNAEKYIVRCLDSIVSQNVEDYEIIIVNDGSTDKTLATIQVYATSKRNIVLIDKKNQGASAARNDAIEMATGDFIMFLDADDYLIESSLDFVRWDENTDLAIYGMVRKARNGTLHNSCKNEARCYRGGEILEMLRDTDCLLLGSSCTKVFRTDILQRHNIRFNTGRRLYEDACFVFQYIMHCDSVYLSDKIIYFYDTSGSVSSGFYGNVFFRDFTEYVRCYTNLVKTISEKYKDNELTCSYLEVIETFSKANSFQNVFTIYKLYRSDISNKYEWLLKCLDFADIITPNWHRYIHKGLPKCVATFHKYPLMLHCFLIIVFKMENMIRRIKS